MMHRDYPFDHSLKSKSPINTCLIHNKTFFFLFLFVLIFHLCKSNEIDAIRKVCTRYAVPHANVRIRRKRSNYLTSEHTMTKDKILAETLTGIAMSPASFRHFAPTQYRRHTFSSSRFVGGYRGLFEYYHSQ